MQKSKHGLLLNFSSPIYAQKMILLLLVIYPSRYYQEF